MLKRKNSSALIFPLIILGIVIPYFLPVAIVLAVILYSRNRAKPGPDSGQPQQEAYDTDTLSETRLDPGRAVPAPPTAPDRPLRQYEEEQEPLFRQEETRREQTSYTGFYNSDLAPWELPPEKPPWEL